MRGFERLSVFKAIAARAQSARHSTTGRVAEMAGTNLDLDSELESASIEHWGTIVISR